MNRFLTTFAAVGALSIALSAPAHAHDADALHDHDVDAVAQSDEDSEDEGSEDSGSEDEGDINDALDDILNEAPREESVEEERDALERGDIDDRAGVRNEDLLSAEQGTETDRTIKTIQRKSFMKLGRFEGMPMAGFVTNDPFLNRYIVGGRLGYHVTEIFAIEGELAYSPDLGRADWKQLTEQLVDNNNVSPDISKLTLIANGTFQFSPIYGKVALSGNKIINFDIYGAFGAGITQTRDDLEALQAEGDPVAEATEVQIQPTTNFGGGARIVFNDTVALRVDGRSLVYIETVKSTTLEMKNNFILSAGVSFFFPGMD